MADVNRLQDLDSCNSDNVTEGTNIYITGAPANLNGIKSRSLLVVGGQVVGYDRPAENGYALIYKVSTFRGLFIFRQR